MIKKCDCKSDTTFNKTAANYQNSTYGVGNRVANKAGEKWRCTVCGRDIGTIDPKKKK